MHLQVDPYFQHFSRIFLYRKTINYCLHIYSNHGEAFNINSKQCSSFIINNLIHFYEATKRSRPSYPRDTANRSDLTLQDGPNQHGTHKPRRTTRTNHSSPRLELQEPAQRHIVSRALRETAKSKTCNPFLHGHSTTLGVGCGFLYFQCKTVLVLLVSTTSYSRHAVSTVQSPISTADNDRSLIDTDGAKTPRNPVLLPYLYITIIPRPVSSFHHFHICIPYLNY